MTHEIYVLCLCRALVWWLHRAHPQRKILIDRCHHCTFTESYLSAHYRELSSHDTRRSCRSQSGSLSTRRATRATFQARIACWTARHGGHRDIPIDLAPRNIVSLHTRSSRLVLSCRLLKTVALLPCPPASPNWVPRPQNVKCEHATWVHRVSCRRRDDGLAGRRFRSTLAWLKISLRTA